MSKYLLGILCVAAMAIFALPVRAADDVVSAVHGTVTKVDSGAKTIVVKSKDGTEHTIHYVDKTAVHGADATATGAKDSYKGVKEGSEVVVHYTEKGTEKTGVEIDRVGKDGVKTVDGTVEPSITPKPPARKSPTSSRSSDNFKFVVELCAQANPKVCGLSRNTDADHDQLAFSNIT
jgi:hypothetical protein